MRVRVRVRVRVWVRVAVMRVRVTATITITVRVVRVTVTVRVRVKEGGTFKKCFFRGRCKLGNFASDPVIEPCANVQDDVGVLNGLVGIKGAVHT